MSNQNKTQNDKQNQDCGGSKQNSSQSTNQTNQSR